MSDISPVNQTYIAQQAQAPNVEPKQVQPSAQFPIENGDEKSMQYLKYAGAALGAAALVGATAAAIIRGKGIDSKYVDMKKLAKTGVAELSEEGKKALEKKKITKFINGINKDGAIKSAKVVSGDTNKIQTFIKNGKRTYQKVNVDGKRVNLWYNSDNKLAKTIKDGVTTTYEYGTDGAAKGKLIKKVAGNNVTAYKYNDAGISEIAINDKDVTKFTKVGKKLEKIEYPNGNVQEFQYDPANGKFIGRRISDKSDKDILLEHIKRNDKGIESIYRKEIVSDGKVISMKKDGLYGVSTKKTGDKEGQVRLFKFGDKKLEVKGDINQGFEYTLNGQKVDSKPEELGKLLGVDQKLFDNVGQAICQ